MEKLQLLPLIILVVYIIAMFLVGIIANKMTIETSEDYMLAGRRMGVIMIACSLSANNVGGGSTTGLAAKAFSGQGIGASWYVLCAAIAMIPLAYFAPKIRETMAVTIPEVVYRRFGDTAGIFTAILNVVSLFCLTASQVLASGSVISTIAGIPLNVGILIGGIIVIFYTTVGGMLADVITDVVQWFIIFFGLLIAVPFVIKGIGGVEVLSQTLPKADLNMFHVGFPYIISLTINYFITFLSGPEMVSRFSATEDSKKAQKAAVLAAVFMAMLAFIPTILGLCAKVVNPTLDNGQGTNAMIWVTSQYAPKIITGFVSAAIVAATMSSADSNLLAASTIVMKDIYQKYINPEIEDKKLIFVTRVCNILICVISMAIALFKIPLVKLNLFAFALRSAGPFAAYALGMVVPKATKNAGVFSIITGSISVLIVQFRGEPYPFGILPIIFGAAVGAITFFLVTYIESKKGVPPAPSAFIEKEK